jgi:glycosyltransferase involved in cell wall biosynthesis
MRTLVVDALRLVGPRTAMGRYIEYMAREWSAAKGPFHSIKLMCPAPVNLEGLSSETPVSVHAPGRGLPNLVWEQFVLARAARGASLLFCPAYVAPLLHGGPLVLANHGIYEGVPGEFSLLRRLRTIPLFRMSVRRADRVIANSLATRADLVKHFKVAEEKVDVVYPAADARFHSQVGSDAIAKTVTAILGEAAPYILFVGKLSRRRNVPALVEGFSIARRLGGLAHRLLIVGPNAGDEPLAQLVARHGLSGVVPHVPHLDQDSLAALYAGADAFVLPTSYEGLSWTMMEALASGTPVLTIAHPTLREVGEGCVHLAASASPKDLAEGLCSLLADAGLRADLKEQGRREAARFSWAASAKETLAILARAALPEDRFRA